jgi:opacity protein-like surface antigen
MKKLFIFMLVVAAFTNAQAQFGIKAGLDLATARVDGYGSESETGLFVGVFSTIELSDTFKIQPELLYVSVKDLDFISLPVLAKFSVADSFHLLAGPSLTYFLDAEDEEFQVNIDFGVSFDVMENLEINAKYSHMLKKEWQLNGFFVGLGYSFN